MQPHAREWTGKQELAAASLASGSTIKRAAEAAGSATRTVAGWLVVPGYRERIAELRAEILSRTVGVVTATSTKASVVLAKLLDDEDPAIRLKAAVSILDRVVRLRESVELSERLDALEQAQGGDHR